MVSTGCHVLSLLGYLWQYGGEGIPNGARNLALVVNRRTATLSFTILHRLLSGVVKSGLCGGHNIGRRGCCRTTTNPLACVFHGEVQAKSAALRINGFRNHC